MISKHTDFHITFDMSFKIKPSILVILISSIVQILVLYDDIILIYLALYMC